MSAMGRRVVICAEDPRRPRALPDLSVLSSMPTIMTPRSLKMRAGPPSNTGASPPSS